MNDIRRTILWVIFGFSLVLLCDQWQIYNGHKATFFPSSTPTAAVTAKGPASSVPNAVPASGVPAATTATPAAGTPGASVPPVAAAAPAAQKVVVTTDVMRLTFDTEGGSLVRTEFPKLAGDNG